MNLGAFLVVIAVAEGGVGDELAAFRGLGRRAPFAAAAMAIFLFSLTGLPPLAGFFGKFYMFSALVARGGTLMVDARRRRRPQLGAVALLLRAHPEGDVLRGARRADGDVRCRHRACTRRCWRSCAVADRGAGGGLAAARTASSTSRFGSGRFRDHEIDEVQHRPRADALLGRSGARTSTAADARSARRPSRARRSSACPSCSARSTSASRGPRALRPGRADPGPDAPRRWRRSRARRGVVVIGSLFERRAPGVYHNTAVVLDADGTLLRPLPQDAHPRRPALLREVLLHARRPRLPRLRHRGRPHRHAGLLGPVVSRRPRGSRRCAAPTSSSTRRRSAGTRARRPSTARRSVDAWQTIQRAHAIANGVYVAAVNRVGHEGPAGRRASSSGAARSSPTRSASCSPRRRAPTEEILIVDVRPRAHRGGAPQLAVPARPPHRRLRADHAAVPRRSSDRCREHARGARLPHAGRVGAARGDLARLAAQRERLARQVRARSPGSTARSCASWRRGERVRILVDDARRRGAARAAAASASGVDLGARRVLPRRRPTAAGRATIGPIFVQRRADGRGRDRRLALQRLGEVPDHKQRRRGRRARSRSALRLRAAAAVRAERRGASCSRAAPSTSTARARCSPPRSACSSAVQARNPGLVARGSSSACSPSTSASRKVLWLGRRHRRRRHPRPRRRPGALRRRRARSSLCRGARPRRRELRAARARTASGCEGARDARRRSRSRSSRCRCRRRSSSTGSGCRRATPTSTSPTTWCWCRPSTTRTIASALDILGRAVPDRAGGRHPRRRSGLGPRHAALPDAAGAGVKRSRAARAHRGARRARCGVRALPADGQAGGDGARRCRRRSCSSGRRRATRSR